MKLKITTNVARIHGHVGGCCGIKEIPVSEGFISKGRIAAGSSYINLRRKNNFMFLYRGMKEELVEAVLEYYEDSPVSFRAFRAPGGSKFLGVLTSCTEFVPLDKLSDTCASVALESGAYRTYFKTTRNDYANIFFGFGSVTSRRDYALKTLKEAGGLKGLDLSSKFPWEMACTPTQKSPYFNWAIRELGFVHRVVSYNPNTSNQINFYVKGEEYV